MDRVRLRVDDARAPLDWLGDWIALRVGTVELGEVEVPVPASVRGRVLGESGAAVPGARVYSPREGVTIDADGRFELARLAPGGCRVRVEAPEHRDAVAKLELAPGEQRDIKLVLRVGRVARGVVVDARGRPVEGAAVFGAWRRRAVATNDAGRFELRGLGPYAKLHVRTQESGGVDDVRARFDADMVIRLPEVFTLGGKVRGADGARMSVELDSDPGGRLHLPPGYTYELQDRALPVDADGSFEIRGLAAGSYRVRAVAEGVGRSAWQSVALERDHRVLLGIERDARMLLTVVDARGEPMGGVRVRMNDDVPSFQSRASESELAGLLRAERTPYVEAVTDGSGIVEISVPHRSPIGILASRRGWLPAARFFEAGQAPSELRLVLRQEAAIAGLVELRYPGAFEAHVEMWRVENDKDARRNGSQNVCEVDAAGAFRRDRLEPGRYRVTLRRRNLGFIQPQAGSTANTLPMIDEGLCRASEIEVDVREGEVAEVMLREAPIGVVEGRVLVAGAPLAGAWVTGVRPLPKRSRRRRPDWTWAGEMEMHAGLVTGSQGHYRLLYVDAGPVELRVRHPAGRATMAPIVVDLPPPGAAVHQDLSIGTGILRGRFRVDLVDMERGRGRVSASLVPMHIARRDHLSGNSQAHAMALVLSCEQVLLSAQSQAFSFEYLPAGDWLLLVTRGLNQALCRKIVTVHRGVTDVGELRPEQGLEVRLQVDVAEGVEPLRGVMLYREHGGDPLGHWIATGLLTGDGIEIGGVEPGPYTVWPFAGSPTNPRQSGEATRIEIDAQGRVAPERVFISEK